MKIIDKKLTEIKPYFRNAKKHNIELIKKSIERFKIDQPIVVDAEGTIIKGHGRYEAAIALGLDSFPVVVRDDLSESEIRRSRIADNKSFINDYDENIMAIELKDLQTLDPA